MTPPEPSSTVLSLFSKVAMLMKACAFQCLSANCNHSKGQTCVL